MVENPAEAAAVYHASDMRQCQDQALVLRAVGIACWIRASTEGYSLLVAERDSARARAELDAYAHENPESSTQESAASPHANGWAGAFVYAAIILLVAICADRAVMSGDWMRAGWADAALIRDGQWWRTVTALTLHAGRAHLIANLVIGALFGVFAARQLGSGLAWLAILLAAAAGNAVNACLRPAEHVSLGASTAVFAALGILAAWAWTQQSVRRLTRLARWSPLIGGVLLLAYLGGGDERTDVGAHIAGFGCGLLAGVLSGWLRLQLRVGRCAQAVLAIVSLAILVLAWTQALAHTAGSSLRG